MSRWIGKEGEKVMAHWMSDDTIDQVSILAKLDLSKEEREQTKRDMERMLDYIDQLDEVDTGDVEPMSHPYGLHNCFREDVVTNGDDREAMLQNAPHVKDNMFVVPRTFR